MLNQALLEIAAQYQAQAEALPLTVPAYDEFNRSIQTALESTDDKELKLTLAQIKFETNRHFDRKRRGL